METQQIAVQHALQDLLSYRQDPVDFATRKRRVQEESYLHVLGLVTELFAQHRRQQHQVIVVNPDEVVVLNMLCKLFGEDAVRIAICNPSVLVKADLTGMVVEKRPQDGVCADGQLLPSTIFTIDGVLT